MSISINHDKCAGCRQCLQVCPGNLLFEDEDGKAQIRNSKDCWGCTACLKECRFGAIKFFLGPDLGGKGTYLYVTKTSQGLDWHFIRPKDSELVISVQDKQANKY